MKGRDVMKEVVGYLLIGQAILTGIVAYSIFRLGDSIIESAAFVGSGEGTLGWGGYFPISLWILLLVVIVMGILLVIRKK